MAQIKRNALIADILATRREILAAAAEIPPELRSKTFLGSWSLLDLLAHLAGWDDANRQAVEAVRSGQLPAFYEFAERSWTTFNAKLVKEYRLDDFDALVERVHSCQQQLVDLLEAVPADDFDRDFKVRFQGLQGHHFPPAAGRAGGREGPSFPDSPAERADAQIRRLNR